MSEAQDQPVIREELLRELSSSAPDYDKIARLSAALLAEDPSRVRFSVDAGMIARLGQELVARHETALSELVKNAYDADATNVVVRLSRAGTGDFIEIEDDGHGMDRDDLVRGFMRLASDQKVREPTSPKFGRRRAGKKGVGRFAAERLGHHLVLTSQTRANAEALQVKVDWDAFKRGSELAAISAPLVQLSKQKPQGTLVRIERLRDTWPLAAVERSFRHISGLIDPGDLTAGSGASSNFYVTFEVDGKAHSVIDTRSQIAAHAYAVIQAEIDGSGSVTWGLASNKLGIVSANRPLRIGDKEQPYAQYARHVKLKAYYFIVDRKNIPPTAYGTVQAYLRENGGIRLYRNGFRVPPYGDPGDDWLGLDQISSVRSRTLAPVRNRNFLGSISIADESGLFEETSSREGIIGTPTFDELRRIMESAVLTAVREIDAERERRGLKNRTNPASAGDTASPNTVADDEAEGAPAAGERSAEDVSAAARAAEDAIKTTTDPAIISAVRQLADKATVAAKHAIQRDALLREIDLLRVLASMGLAIGEFTHEFSTISGAMRSDLARLIEPGRSDSERQEAARTLRLLLNQARNFTGLFKSMTEDNALRDRGPIDLYAAATSFRSSLSSVLERNGVVLEVDDTGDEVVTPPMHRSEIFAVFLNFTTNSIKAIKRSGRAGKILIRLSTTNAGGATIDFLDNGDGIAEEVRDNVFEPFVTTTAAKGASSSDEDLSRGSGLGLAIVRDIISTNGGEVRVSDASDGYATCFQITFPAQ